MDELEQILQTIKSLKEATLQDIQGLYKRYETMGASGSAENNEVFLHQQNLSVQVVDKEITTKELEGMCEERGIKYDKAYEGRVKLYKASDETVDSAGDIIRQSGWNFSRYKTNPVFAYCHDYYVLPIGSGLKWYVKDNALYIYNMFALPEANPWADMCLNMVNAKMLNGNSVGFIPQKVLRVEDENERAKLGLGRWGVIFEKAVLLEDSACALGCNPSALVQDELAKALQKGIVSKESLSRIVKSDSAVNIPDSLKIAADRAVLMVNRKVFVETVKDEPIIKNTATIANELKSAIDNNSEILNAVKLEIQTIKTEMAEIRSKFESAGTGGKKPETETVAEKELYDLIAGINGVSKTIENNL